MDGRMLYVDEIGEGDGVMLVQKGDAHVHPIVVGRGVDGGT